MQFAYVVYKITDHTVFFQGYDVESVLGNDLGPLTCVVVSVTKRKDSGHFVLQELTTRSHPI